MASIRDYATASDDADVTIHTAAMPTFEVGDLLLFCVGKDTITGGELNTPAGWSRVNATDAQNFGVRAAAFWKFAVASEPAPGTGNTDTDTYSSVLFSVRNAGATPINTFGINPTTGNARRIQMPSVTTTASNCLLIYFTASDGNRGVSFDPSENPPMGLLTVDAVGMGIGAAWGFKQTAGLVDAPFIYVRQNDDQARITIAINDDGTGDVPGYNPLTNVANKILHPIWGTVTDTDWGGSTTNGVPTGITTVNGITCIAAEATINQQDAGVNTLHDGYRIQCKPAQHGQFATSYVTFDSPISLVGLPLCVVHAQVAFPRSANLIGTLTDGSVVIAIMDSSNNWRAWHMGARDSLPNLRNMIPLVFDPADATYAYDESATAVDLADIDRIVFLIRNVVSTADLLFNMFQSAETIQIVGGYAADPAGFIAANEYSSGADNLTVQRQSGQADSQYVAFQRLQIGNGGVDVTYFAESAVSLEFAETPNAAKKKIQYQAAPGVLGLEIRLSVGSTVKLNNSSLSSASKWYFRISPFTSPFANYDFNGLQVINAQVSLRPLGYAIAGIGFTRCGEIAANGANLSGGNTIAESTSPQAIRITDQTDLDNIANCTFKDNAGGILIDVSGDITLTADNVKFEGNTADLLYNGGGTVTWINTNGSNASTSGGTGTVVIEEPVTLSINVAFFGAVAPANYEWRLYIDDPSPGVIGTVELAGAENETATALTYQYNYTADQTAILQVIADGFIEPRPITIILSNLDQAIGVNMDADPNI